MAEFIEPYDPNLILTAAAVTLALLLGIAALGVARMRSRQATMGRSLGFGLLVLIILLLPAFFAVMLIGELDWATKFAAESATTTGEVVDLIEYQGTEGDEVYAAVVRFTTPDGQTATVEDSERCLPPCYDIGEEVPVRYRTADPGDAILDSGNTLWRGTIISAVLAGVGLLLSPLLIHQAYIKLKPRTGRAAPSS